MRAILFLFLLVAIAASRSQRFADGDMMRAHHSHKNPSNAIIKVILIPHSHDDVGWLKTVDDYYYGGDQTTQWAGVQYTIDTVVTELSLNPKYRFSIVEVAFLYRWWNNANDTQRNLIKQHFASGQLEFINGGWCMSDEATPYYEDMVDQMTIGLRWLKDTFGAVPRVGWHIDPFGHQASNAAMFSQTGFDAWFFARIDYQDKALRMSSKSLEMLWKPPQYSGNDNSIFTHVNYYHYSAPPGFNFDLKFQDTPIKDDLTLEDYNLDSKATTLVNYFKSQALHYRSNTLMHTIGEDFSYANARMWFKNYDKLIAYVNTHPEFGVTLAYGTPGEYVQQVNRDNITFPSKYDDFFPYADGDHMYWTGYFTSRVAVKGLVRDLGRYLQAVRTHLALLKLGNSSSVVVGRPADVEAALWEAEMAMGILQHHDAVAGTEKQKVANDYVRTAGRAFAVLNGFYNQVRQEQAVADVGENLTAITIPNWNATSDAWGVAKALNASKAVLLQLYNPGPKGTFPIRVKLEERSLDIVGANNSKVPGDLFCPNTRDSRDCELLFYLAFEEASFSYVKLVGLSSGGSVKVAKLKEITAVDPVKEFNLSTTATLKYTRSQIKFDLSLSNDTSTFYLFYNYYESYQGSGQKSGAYIFRPSDATIQTSKRYSNYKTHWYAEGEQFLVIALDADKTYTKLYFSKAAGEVDAHGFEIETFVDSISVDDGIGKEIVLSLGANWSNNGTFFTDSNGLEEQKRVLDYRPTWSLVVTEPASGNYYPVNSHIAILNANASGKRLSVLVDRSQGGSVLREGAIELMVHRRTLRDDARGVDEPLNETEENGAGLRQIVRHYVVVGERNREVQKLNDQKVTLAWSPSTTTTFAKAPAAKSPFPVPSSVKLFLRPFKDGSYLLRLHNFDTKNPAAVTVPAGWTATELTLGANQLLTDWQAKRLKWLSTGADTPSELLPEQQGKHSRVTEMPRDSQLQLKPFEIRTFRLSR